MNRFVWATVLCAGLILSGCGKNAPVISISTEAPMTVATAPAVRDPHHVSCKDSYTGTGSPDAVVARMEGAELTNEELQFWYWAEVNQYRQSQRTPAPDFEQPLEGQTCGLDTSVNWQQYFLNEALERWHTANALILHSRETPLPLEEAYTGDPEILEDYMGKMPASRLLYGFDPYYKPNSQHQHYLEQLQEQFSGPQLHAAETLNKAYMYFTTLSYNLPKAEAASAEASEPLVSFRHILLLPEEEETMGTLLERATALLSGWMADPKATADTFAQLASLHSQDPGSAKSGGIYQNLRREQLAEDIAQWCFDESRQEGDTTILPLADRVYILYFLDRTDTAAVDAVRQGQLEAQQALLTSLKEAVSVQVDYEKILLPEVGTGHSVSELLYPDIAHQRFPEVPLYLQQDYFSTLYGNYWLRTNGCGITSLAMLASYMVDDELTPPELSARYGRYSRPTGTAGSLFEEAPPQLGFYLLKKSYDWREVREYMQEGYPAIVVQHKGYWTSGGHYLVLETLTEDGMVQVRDSNMFNYRKLKRHQEDKFPWDTLQSGGKCYWIYEKKAVSCPACIRCGDPQALENTILRDYLCPKCQTALVRRTAYLSGA